MTRKFSLQPLLDLARHRVDTAAKNLLSLKRRWHDAEEQLNQLLAYQESYRTRLRELAAGGTSVMSLRDFHLFMDKLDKAISLQREEIARCQARWEAGQQEWLRQQGRLKAFDTLSARHKRAEGKLELRIEQKAQDEFASRKTTRDLHDPDDEQ